MFQAFASGELPPHTTPIVDFQTASAAAAKPFLQRLDESFINRMIALQATDTTGNTIFRSGEFIAAMLKRGDTAFGVVTPDGELVGQAIVRSNMNLLPDSLRIMFNAQTGPHAYIGSILVHPDYKGQKIMSTLVDTCLDEAATRGNTDVHVRVRDGNEASLKAFTHKFGFTKIMTGQSPDAPKGEDRLVHFMHRCLI